MDMLVGVVCVAALGLVYPGLRGLPERLHHGLGDGGSEADIKEVEANSSPFMHKINWVILAAAAAGACAAALRSRRPDAADGSDAFAPSDLPRLICWMILSCQLFLALTCDTRVFSKASGACALTAAILVCAILQDPHCSINNQSNCVQLMSAATILLGCLSLPRNVSVSSKRFCVDQQSRVSILSKLTFSWNPLHSPPFSTLNNFDLQQLPILPSSQRVKYFRGKFSFCAGQDVLWRRLAQAFKPQIILQWLLIFIHGLSQFLTQYMLFEMLRCLESRPRRQKDALQYVISLGLALLVENTSAGWITWTTQTKLSTPMVALLRSLVFEKTTRRPGWYDPSTCEFSKDGKTFTEQPSLSLESIMSNDCSLVSQACSSSHHFPKAALKLAIDVAYLSRLIGFKNVFLGCLFSAAVFLASTKISQSHAGIQAKLAKAHNAFSKQVAEAIRNLRIIRLSSMESFWEGRIIRAREKELQQIWNHRSAMASLALFANLGPLLLTSVALSMYAWRTGHLSPSVAFASIGMFRNLHAAIQELPLMVTNLQESMAASRRIQSYLEVPEEKSKALPSSEFYFKNATLSWPHMRRRDLALESAFKLHNICLDFPRGKLSIVTGNTGSGKGLLLAALLGEAVVETGDFGSPRSGMLDHDKLTSAADISIAYVSQPPWIQDRTIKENVLFGNSWDESRYKNVLRVCSLEHDINILPRGDATKAGVNGGALSGGQRWRVALARALYSFARTIILDDLLSAVDSKVAAWICDHALSGELARDRTIIIATHQLSLCQPLASYIVTVAENTASGQANIPRAHPYKQLDRELSPRSATSSPKPLVSPNSPERALTARKSEARRSHIDIFTSYLYASGGMGDITLGAVATISCRLIVAGNSWWLTRWTSGDDIDNAYLRRNLCIYLLLSIGSAFAVALHTRIIQGMSIRASRALFQQMANKMLHSPLHWINSTPLGTLMQSMGSDMYLVDYRTAPGLADLLRLAVQLVFIIGASFTTAPYTIFLSVTMFFVYIAITPKHLHASKKLQRLVPLALQPILEHSNSAEDGLLTIRAFGKVEAWQERMHDMLDIDTNLSWHITLAQRWIHARYGILGSFFVAVTAAALVFRGVDAATAGFTITLALQIKATMSGMMGKVNLLESGARALNRVLDIAEMQTETEQGSPAPHSWPSSGRISIDRLTAGYDANLPPVLSNVSFNVAPRQRIGIVGRTGAGKTSLSSALLRFLHCSEGTIRIDGVDITNIQLRRLRDSICIAAQDASLFSGTVRTNLNAGEDDDDEKLVAALRKVFIRGNNSHSQAESLLDLDMVVHQDGANLSQGQRQLICLARAMLKPRRILVLDEATSGVDRATDAELQRVIRREFAKSTILVITHRLDMVAQYDKVLVLHEGRVAEFGSPSELMVSKGLFWDMVRQSGDIRAI